MRVLISPICLDEAQAVFDGGADIIDIKNVAEGSLGASFPWIIRSVAERFKGEPITVSATLGDLPYKPGTASLAALGAIHAGARYIKAGLYGTRTYDEALDVMQAVVHTCRDADPGLIAVAAGYADYRRFGGLDPLTIVKVARDSNADLAMLDTAIKDGSNLFDSLSQDEIAAFVSAAHGAGLQVALAGSLKASHLDRLRGLGADIIGIRGAVCRSHDRTTAIDAGLVRDFVSRARMLAARIA